MTDFNDSVKSFKEADFMVNTYVTTCFQENNWLFAHPVEPIRKLNKKPFLTDSIFCKDYIILSYSKKETSQRSDDLMGWYFGKDQAVWIIQSLWANKWSTASDYDGYLTTAECHEELLSPKWYSAFDVSKIKFKIDLGGADSLYRLTINWGERIANISELIPYPDEKTIHGITYDSPEKIAQIKEHGLEIYATFPEYESLQQTRNYVLSALITLFLTLTATIGWNLACSSYKRLKRLNRVRKKVIFVHDKIYIKLNNYLIANIIIIWIIIASTIYLINPYDWQLSEFAMLLLYSIGSFLLDFQTRRLIIKKKRITKKLAKYHSRQYFAGCILVLMGFLGRMAVQIRAGLIDGNGFIYYFLTSAFLVLSIYSLKMNYRKQLKIMWKNRHKTDK